jgi:nicotinamide-nucleotide amidase
MHAEVIAIGDELTSGQRLDTNSAWLSQRLEEIGVPVLFHTTVGDDLAANTEVFRTAGQRADIVISTGGLGPTADDLTREALAAATGTELVLDQAALAHIRRLFARRRREMPERNVVQAMFPRGSEPIPNPHGTAPGVDVRIPRPVLPPSRIFALPGVPAEMREMWQQTVQPAVHEMLAGLPGGTRCIRHHAIRCFGIGESDLEAMLPDLIRRGREPRVGITVSRATITLRITATAATAEACAGLIEPTVATIRRCLGDLIFGEGEDELQDAVVRLLSAARQTLATVEHGPGGLLAHWLSQSDPGAQVFRGGWILRHPHEALADATDPAAETAESALVAMAEQARSHFATDWTLAVGPFPPSDGEHQVPGNLQLVLAGPGGSHRQSTPFAGHPDLLKQRAVKQALDLLRRQLLRG